jgi:23S rRNA pseudouridine2605 synthase
MSHDAERGSGEAEFQAAIESATEDAIGASAEPAAGAAPEAEISVEPKAPRKARKKKAKSEAASSPEEPPLMPEPSAAAPEVGAEPAPPRKSKRKKAESKAAPSSEEAAPPPVPEAAAPEIPAEPEPAPKLDRLQKILAQAGVASRRQAEEMITQGRVQVNGQVVTTLGTKADASRDHIRVDGKLIHGAERLRYFILNKPKGFVTTVSDPERRPTVMQFFDKMHERLYPVGRLDYQSEGLLLVTNDGELANKLTRAASGVEKTYLVKVSGQPTEAELDILRRGVAIDRDLPGGGRVQTAPARVRQVRQGDNPWYEVVLIEGRNRELRKMFQEIGHFVEKIRRVGYGPLVLDVEPGKLRELEPDELAALRKAAEGKWRTPKSKEIRRRNAADATQLPTVAPRPSLARPSPPRPVQSFPPAKPFRERPTASRPAEFRPKKSFGAERSSGSPRGPVRSRPSGEAFRPGAGARPAQFGPARFGPSRPPFKRDNRPAGSTARYSGGSSGAAGPARERASTSRPFPAKPAWKHQDRNERTPFKRPLRGDSVQSDSRRPFQRDDWRSSPQRRPSGPFASSGRQNTGPARPFTARGGGANAPGLRGTGPRGTGSRDTGSRGSRDFERSGPSFRREAGGSGSGWKPKPSFGGRPQPNAGGKLKFTPGNASGKSGGKPFRPAPGSKRSGPPRGSRPSGGKSPGGK